MNSITAIQPISPVFGMRNDLYSQDKKDDPRRQKNGRDKNCKKRSHRGNFRGSNGKFR